MKKQLPSAILRVIIFTLILQIPFYAKAQGWSKRIRDTAIAYQSDIGVINGSIYYVTREGSQNSIYLYKIGPSLNRIRVAHIADSAADPGFFTVNNSIYLAYCHTIKTSTPGNFTDARIYRVDTLGNASLLKVTRLADHIFSSPKPVLSYSKVLDRLFLTAIAKDSVGLSVKLKLTVASYYFNGFGYNGSISWNLPPTSYGLYPYQVTDAIAGTDSSIIVYINSFFGSRSTDSSIVMKLDTASRLMWRKNFVHHYNSGSIIYYRAINRVSVISDGSIFLEGSRRVGGTQTTGSLLLKLNSRGDSLWENAYNGSTYTGTNDSEECFNVLEQPNGRLVLFVKYDRYSALLDVDKNGKFYGVTKLALVSNYFKGQRAVASGNGYYWAGGLLPYYEPVNIYNPMDFYKIDSVSKPYVMHITGQTICGNCGNVGVSVIGDKYKWGTGDTTASVKICNTTYTNFPVTVTTGFATMKDSVPVTFFAKNSISVTKDTTICYGDSVYIQAKASNSKVSWYVNNKPYSTLSALYVHPAAPTYFRYTVQSGTCSVTDSIYIGVSTSCGKLSLGPDIIQCSSCPILKSNLTGINYYWSFDSTGKYRSSQSVTYCAKAKDTVILKLEVKTGVFFSDTVVVTNNMPVQNPMVHRLTKGLNPEGKKYPVTLVATGGTKYDWYFGDSAHRFASTFVVPTDTPSRQKFYSVRKWKNTCGPVTDYFMVETVNRFNSIPSSVSGCANDRISVTSTFTTGASSVIRSNKWNFGDGTGWVNSDTMSHKYTSKGVYVIYHKYWNSISSDTLTDTIYAYIGEKLAKQSDQYFTTRNKWPWMPYWNHDSLPVSITVGGHIRWIVPIGDRLNDLDSNSTWLHVARNTSGNVVTHDIQVIRTSTLNSGCDSQLNHIYVTVLPENSIHLVDSLCSSGTGKFYSTVSNRSKGYWVVTFGNERDTINTDTLKYDFVEGFSYGIIHAYVDTTFEDSTQYEYYSLDMNRVGAYTHYVVACVNDSVTIAAKGASSFLWRGPGLTDSTDYYIKVKATASGKYYLRTTNTRGCVYYDTITLFVDTNCVWPGDANYDKTVSMSDVLKIGLAYGDTGYARPDTSTSWSKHPCRDWAVKFPSGLNKKQADCNGDGVVSAADANAVLRNYGKTHPKNSRVHQKTSPVLSIEFPKDSFTVGDTIKAKLMLGTSALPANDFYGLAVSLSYDQDLLNQLPVGLDISGSWMGSKSNLLRVIKDDRKSGRVDFAITRTDHKNVSGYGQIGELSIVVIDNVGGKRTVAKPFKISFLDVFAISADDVEIDLNPQGDSAVIYQEKTGIETTMEHGSIYVYPNPAGNFVNVDCGNEPGSSIISIADLLGNQALEIKTLKPGLNSLDVSSLANGTYIMRITSGNNTLVRKLVIVK